MPVEPKVAVVLPVYKPDLNEYEKISFRLVDQVLSAHPRFLIKPYSLDLEFPGWLSASFDNHFFSSHNNYSKLMLEADFYRRFEAFDYILIYQLDSLVLSDQLLYWCSRQYDYIGPLWDRQEIERWEKVVWNYVDFGCGNGGFSLRRVEACIDVLDLAIVEAETVLGLRGEPGSFGDIIQRYSKHLHKNKIFSNNEDMFWGFLASRFRPNFKLGSLKDALAFGFEYSPEKCLEMNEYLLPFGAHAWFKFEKSRNFWLQVLESKFDLQQLSQDF